MVVLPVAWEAMAVEVKAAAARVAAAPVAALGVAEMGEERVVEATAAPHCLVETAAAMA